MKNIYVEDLLKEIEAMEPQILSDDEYLAGKEDPSWKVIDNLINRVPNIYKDDLEWLDVEIATDGDELLFRYESDCERFADALDDHVFGCHECHTGYYDPEEDERSNEVDEHTGWYYVDFD